MTTRETNEERAAEVIAMLTQRKEGLRGREIAEAMFLKRAHLWALLPKMADAGIIVMIGTMQANGRIGGSHIRYCLPEHKTLAEVAANMHSVGYKRRARQRDSTCKGALAYTDEEIENMPDVPMVQRVVCAKSAPPLCKLGPASVFELGVMAA